MKWKQGVKSRYTVVIEEYLGIMEKHQEHQTENDMQAALLTLRV